MPWAKFSDHFDDDVDASALSGDAIALFVCSVTWSSKVLSDGFIPASKAARLPCSSPRAIDELCRGDRPWWEPCEGGYRVRSFLKYNPSAEDVRSQRAANQERVEKSRKRKTQRVTDGVTIDITEHVTDGVEIAATDPATEAVTSERGNGDCNAIGNGGCNSTPVPVPVPLSPNPVPVPNSEPGKNIGGASRPPTRKGVSSASEVDREFQEFRAAYPKRGGDANAKKGLEVFRKHRARGVDLEAILGGARRYAAFCEACGKVGTEYVQQIPTWLNREGWNEDWEIPDEVRKPPPAPRRSGPGLAQTPPSPDDRAKLIAAAKEAKASGRMI